MITTTQPEDRHLHIHLGDLAPGTHVHIHAGTPPEDATAKPTAADSLQRLKDWDPTNAGNVQAMHDGLAELGCTPHPAKIRTTRPDAKNQPYLRWTRRKWTVGYLNAATFSVAGKNDVPKVDHLPGAVVRGSEVRFPITSPEGVQQALAAVRHLLVEEERSV